MASEKTDIGECKSLKIRCITETSWFDNAQLIKDIMGTGGPSANQYAIQCLLDPFCSLVEFFVPMESLASIKNKNPSGGGEWQSSLI